MNAPQHTIESLEKNWNNAINLSINRTRERDALFQKVEVLSNERDALEAECAVLRKIVDRLPKTADGVPISTKTEVWYIHPSGEVKMTFMDASGFSPRIVNPPEKCFYYRSSAIAAQQERGASERFNQPISSRR